MICDACADQRHERCRGGNWCDCQHRPRGLSERPQATPDSLPEPQPPVTGPAGEPRR